LNLKTYLFCWKAFLVQGISNNLTLYPAVSLPGLMPGYDLSSVFLLSFSEKLSQILAYQFILTRSDSGYSAQIFPSSRAGVELAVLPGQCLKKIGRPGGAFRIFFILIFPKVPR
jgi:hypothetical protein